MASLKDLIVANGSINMNSHVAAHVALDEFNAAHNAEIGRLSAARLAPVNKLAIASRQLVMLTYERGVVVSEIKTLTRAVVRKDGRSYLQSKAGHKPRVDMLFDVARDIDTRIALLKRDIQITSSAIHAG